jgi:Anthranilate/para-aminobenzoate synthases component I
MLWQSASALCLDSAQSNDGLGEWSYFGADPFVWVSGKDGQDAISVAEGFDLDASRFSGSGLSLLRQLMVAYQDRIEASEIPFCGGAVGYIAYDYGRRLEQVPVSTLDDRDIPDFDFGLYDGIAALHVESGRLYLISLGICGSEAEGIARLQAIMDVPCSPSVAVPISCGEWTWNASPEEFKSAVEKVRDYIASGDVYQVNLTQRARACFDGDALALYQALRQGNPAPYGAYLDCGEMQIISTSPEQFLSKRGRRVETRPIKGTRPRDGSAMTDSMQAEALRASAKDRAELLMIVDLERNDLGRVAEYGTVRVDGLYQLEYYARVVHQTARVQAQLREDLDVL